MRKSNKYILYMFLFLLYIPSISWFFVADDSSYNKIDNRKLYDFPVLNIITVKQFPENFDKYYNDHVPYRTALINFNSIMQYKIFGFVNSSKVVFGQNGWLFYCDKNDGDSMGDYKRINQFSYSEMDEIAQKINYVKRKVEDRGAKFIYFLAPNKENVYPEYMPKGIIRANYTPRTYQFSKYLKSKYGIEVIFPFDSILLMKNKYPVYDRLDTHWSVPGAYAGTSVLLKEMNIILPNISSFHCQEIFNANNELAKMAGFIDPKQILGDSSTTSVDLWKDMPIKKEDITDEITRFTNPLAESDKKVVFIGDSFRGAMMPIMAIKFKNILFIHRNSFLFDYLDSEKPDYVIYENVERTIPDILVYSEKF